MLVFLGSSNSYRLKLCLAIIQQVTGTDCRSTEHTTDMKVVKAATCSAAIPIGPTVISTVTAMLSRRSQRKSTPCDVQCGT